MNKFTKYILLLFLMFEVSAFVSAQNIDYQVYSTRYYTGRGNSDFWTSDDPRWIFLVYDNLDGYAAGQGVIRSIDNGLDGAAWDNPADFLCRQAYNVNATGWKVYIDGWEDDGCGASNTYNTGCANDDEARSTLLSGVLDFRLGTNCGYTTYQINAPNYWAVEYSVYWQYAVAPTITSQPSPDDRNVCVGTGTTISVVADAAAKFYQWQVSTTTGTPQAGCPSSGWVNVSSGTGGTTANYTPPQTPGSRLYRCLITSNCTADFNSKTVASNCVRVNYFPYTIPIISSVCGGTTSIGSTVPFTVPVVPAVGAIANGSYTWAISPAGPTISAPNSISTNITFPTTGTYTITVTLDDNGGPCSPQVSANCTVIVNNPDCEYVYVDPTTSNTSGGSSNTPVTLAAAIPLLSSTRNHIRMAGGTYNNVPVITLPNSGTGINNVIIEGGYVNTGGVWTKSTSPANATIINFVGTETIDNNVAHVVGFKLVSTIGTTLQDLTMTTAAASGTTVNGHGKSNYAIYINSSTNYTITRCSITSGNATGGATGAKGGTGGNGNASFGPGYGGDGSCDCFWGCGECGGAGGGGGGSGGGGGTGTNGGGGVAIGANGAGGAGGNGGAGGAGGPGKCAGNDVNSGNTSAGGSGGANGGAGGAGTGGGGGGAGTGGSSPGARGVSGAGGTGSCDNGACGGNGTAGTAGGTGGAGGIPGADVYSGGWFQPSAGTNGGGGGGGKGGAGGGGGSGSHDSGTCDRDSGKGGAGGGGGGGGGAGGFGGGGGGASFGIFVYAGGAGGTVTNSVLNTGTAGTGGAGGAGGDPGSGGGGLGSVGGCGGGEGGCGGASGGGGNGGTGGAGGTGRGGPRYAIANFGGTAPTQSLVTVNSSTSGGSTTNPTGTYTVVWNNQKGCTNSYVNLTKSANTWSNYGSGGTLVNDITSSTSSFSTASSPVSVIYSTTGWKDIATTSATDSRDRLLYITTTRTPPVINGISSPICKDGSLTLSCTPNSPSTVVAYEWTIQLTPVTGLNTPVPVYTSSASSFTYSFANAGGSAITYQIKLRVQDQCCGWSIPVYGSVTVNPLVTAGAIGSNQTICYNTTPATLTNATTPANTVGTITYQWYYQDNCTGPWIAIPSSNAATYSPGALTNTRCYYREMTNCTYTLNSNTVTITVNPNFDPGSVLPDHEGICTNTIPGTKYMSTAPSGGAGTYNYQWYYKDGVGNACPTGTATTGWTLISGANANTYTPPALTADRTYALQVDATGTPDCGVATWATNCTKDTVHRNPIGTPALYRLYQCDLTAILNVNGIVPHPVPDSVQINWTKTAGSGNPNTSSDTILIVNSLTAGATTTYKLEMSNNWCKNVNMGSVNITPTTNSSTIISNPSPASFECASCIIPDGITKTYFDVTGKIIGKIEDDGAITPSYLDSTELCVKVLGSVPTVVDNYGLNQPYLQRYWTIKPKTHTSSIVTLYFTNTELTNLQTAASSTRYQFSGYNLYVTKFPNGGAGTFTPPCTGGTVPCPVVTGVSVPSIFGFDVSKGFHYVTFTVSSFSTFYIHPALFPFAPLPVELISFTGWNEGAVNKLQWKTASEKNTVKFEIQKSLESSNWSAIGEKPASGNSTVERSYDFNDNNPVIGNNYYRLKIIDADGTFNYSNVINIPISNAIINSFVQVYPNPTTGILNVDIQSTSAYDIKMSTFDVLGKKVLEKSMGIVKGLNTLTLDYSILAKGTYVLQYIDGEGKVHSTKFVKD